jgi:hypothetical protein
MSSCLERRLRSNALRAGLVLCLGGASLATPGCTQQPQASTLPSTPMQIDPAMQRRDWERSAAWYPNGDTVSGVNRFPIRSQGGNPASPDYTNALIDLGASAAQTIALPFTYLFVPPFERATYTGEPIPPTHTAMPHAAPPPPPGEYGVEVLGQEERLQRLESPQPLPRRAAPQERDRRRGPLGPGDSDFMSSPPTPEEPD